MKKILILCTTLLMVVACQNTKPNKHVLVDGAKTSIIKMDGKDVFNKNDLFSANIALGSLNIIMPKLINDIYQLENLKSVDEEVNTAINKIKEQLKDKFEAQIKRGGFETEEQFKANFATQNKLTNLIKAYVEKDYDKNIALLRPKKVEIVKFKEEEQAKEFIEKVKKDRSFEEVSKDYDKQAEYKSEVITEKHKLLPELKKAILTKTDLGLSEVVKQNKDFYVFNIVDNNANNFKEEAIKAMASHMPFPEVLAFYLKKYNFKVYDQTLYDVFSQQFPGVLN